MKLPFSKEKPQLPALLSTEIKFTRSVIHASMQASAGAINEALGVTDPTLVDQFLETETGKRWQQGFRDYAIFVLGKTI